MLDRIANMANHLWSFTIMQHANICENKCKIVLPLASHPYACKVNFCLRQCAPLLDRRLGGFIYKKVWFVWCIFSNKVHLGAPENECLVIQSRGINALALNMSDLLMRGKNIYENSHFPLLWHNKWVHIVQISLGCCLYMYLTINVHIVPFRYLY